MVEITKKNFDRDVLQSAKLVMVDFWAPWCAPCRVIAPAVEKIAEELQAAVMVGKANVDEEGELATELSVMNIPTLVFFKGGKEVSRMIGVNTKEAIETKIAKLNGEA